MATKPKGIPESVVLSECLFYLQISGIYCWRNNTGGTKTKTGFIRFGKVGSSDILGILPDGRFLAVECKRERGGKVSEQQKVFLDMIEKNHGVAWVVNSLEDLQGKMAILFARKNNEGA